MMHIKEPLLLIEKSSPCGGSGFPLSLSEWSFVICLTPSNRKYNLLSASLNKTLSSSLPTQICVPMSFFLYHYPRILSRIDFLFIDFFFLCCKLTKY